MRGAIDEYQEIVERGQTVNVSFLARAWNIPKVTLQRRISGKVAGSGYASGRKQYLPEDSEKELANLIKLLSKRGFLLNKREVQGIAFIMQRPIMSKAFLKQKALLGITGFEIF